MKRLVVCLLVVTAFTAIAEENKENPVHGAAAGNNGFQGGGRQRPVAAAQVNPTFTLERLKDVLAEENFAVDADGKLFRPGKRVNDTYALLSNKSIRFCADTKEMAYLRQRGYVVDGEGRVFERGPAVKDGYGNGRSMQTYLSRVVDVYGGADPLPLFDDVVPHHEHPAPLKKKKK